MFNLTFLNALFLAGAAAGIVPIIIHLLNRRRLRRIEFSDLRFLAPLNQQRMRSLNLRRLLLLALRVLVIVLTAVAMARPSVRGSLSRLLPAEARSSVLLLIDTSYSMRAEGESGTAFAAARAVALRLVDALERGDEIHLMTFDDAPRKHFDAGVHDLDMVRQRLRELEPGHGGTRWGEALQAALAELARAREPNAELYVLSDGVGPGLDSVRLDLSALQGNVRISFVPVRVERFVNVSLDGVQVPPGAVLQDEPVRVGVTVRNHTPDVPAECNLLVELDGEPRAEANLRLGGAEVRTQEFTLVAARAEEAAGTARKRIDRLPEDDVRYFVLPVLGQLRVLLVAGESAAGGTFFVARALAPTPEGRSPIACREVPAARFSSGDLDGVQVAVVASDARLGDGQAQILADFVADGGGLVLWSGQRDSAEPLNRLLLERLGSGRVRGVVQRQEGYLNLENLRPSGILAGFKETELRTLENVRFTRYAELVAGAEDRAVLRFAGGQPALVEGRRGNGKYMLFGFDAGLDGSDLAVSPMFLPLVHRAVVYLAGETGRQKLDYHVGERIEVQVPVSGPGSQARAGDDPRWAQAGVLDGGVRPAAAERRGVDPSFMVTTPAGERAALVPRIVGRMAVASFEDTRTPGHYVFEAGGRRLVRAVNVDTRESDLSPLDLESLARELGLESVAVVEDAADVERHVRQARHGKELYKLVAAMVLVLLTVELFVARAARARAG